ncbi:MAG: AAA family ATPase [Peptococcaceae bacterium]|jgi:stage V sporulation protein K|nr:AAA family ATPase [Peptococcaceae bacterium]
MPIYVKFRPEEKMPPLVRMPQNAENTAKMRVFPDLNQPGAGSIRKQEGAGTEKDRLAEIIAELDHLVGLTFVKKLIHELQAYVEIQRRREKEKLIADPLVLHMIFRGNPGTGKTTVARLISRLFKELGFLQKGHVIECERADLVGEYIGHTAQKTREQIKKALGGVLFIDEAYSLARGGGKDFGKEAIDVLVKAMEDNKENLILILAGYRQEMECFLQTNPGLRSRFPIHIDFPDYTLDELVAISELFLKKRQYELSAEAKRILREHLAQGTPLHSYAGNARMIRNMIELTIRKQAVRLYRRSYTSKEELMKIMPIDLTWE